MRRELRKIIEHLEFYEDNTEKGVTWVPKFMYTKCIKELKELHEKMKKEGIE